MKVAVVGSGIAGLTSAYHLDDEHQVTVFEKNNYLGGHNKIEQRIDSGFIIFCKEFYPNFCAMLDDLGVESKPTDMSFGVFKESNGLQYNATNPNTLFCDRKNLVNPRFLRMLIDIVRFYNLAPNVLKNDDETTSVKQYLERHHYSKAFMEDHFFPMIGALWSVPPQLVHQFPIRYLVEFMKAHGLMKILNRPQWRVMKDGSNGYIQALRSKLRNTEFRVNCGVTSIIREEDRVLIHSASHEPEYFDAVIICSHADQARSMLQMPSKKEYEILGDIPFQKNNITIHTDESIMPPNRKAWSSWNVQIPANNDKHYNASYWMNLLQSLSLPENVFVSLNETREIDEAKILGKRVYHHPTYSAKSVDARRRLASINGKNRTFYAGAFWAWGFHEDGARTAVDAVNLLNKTLS